MLKTAIVLLMLALVASLGSGFYYLMIDQGDNTKKRVYNSLSVRLCLALSLATLLVYGIASGQLGQSNPWDGGPVTDQSAAPK